MTEFSKLIKKITVKIVFADDSDMEFGIDANTFYSAFGDTRPDKPGVFMGYSTPVEDKNND